MQSLSSSEEAEDRNTLLPCLSDCVVCTSPFPFVIIGDEPWALAGHELILCEEASGIVALAEREAMVGMNKQAVVSCLL